MVLRVFDRGLARMMELNFGFQHVRSTSALAAPWFVGASLGLDIIETFYVDQQPFIVGRLVIAPGGGLQGLAMRTSPPGHGSSPFVEPRAPTCLSIRLDATPASRPETRCSCSDPTRNSSGSCGVTRSPRADSPDLSKTEGLLVGVDHSATPPPAPLSAESVEQLWQATYSFDDMIRRGTASHQVMFAEIPCPDQNTGDADLLRAEHIGLDVVAHHHHLTRR